MRKTLIVSALISMGAIFAGAAQAQTYTIQVPVDHCVASYKKVYVPSTVLVNPRGKLYATRHRSVNIIGDRYDFVSNPAIYFETRRTIIPDYYSLQAQPTCTQPY